MILKHLLVGPLQVNCYILGCERTKQAAVIDPGGDVDQILLALAKDVPDPKGGEILVPNPYRTWREVNPSLPNKKIEVLGPPPTSGTRDAFVELAMEAGAKKLGWLKALRKQNKKKFFL